MKLMEAKPIPTQNLVNDASPIEESTGLNNVSQQIPFTVKETSMSRKVLVNPNFQSWCTYHNAISNKAH